MLYAEFAKLSPEEGADVLQSLSGDEVSYLWDQRPFEMPALEPIKGHKYFDDIDDLHAYLLKHHVPEAKPWRASETAAHELAHAECALAVGAVGVAYSFRKKMHPQTKNHVFTHYYGPASLPNLAWAAIDVHPYDATKSITDMRNIHEYGYTSREQVASRIARWNEMNNGLLIPPPQTLRSIYPQP